MCFKQQNTCRTLWSHLLLTQNAAQTLLFHMCHGRCFRQALLDRCLPVALHLCQKSRPPSRAPSASACCDANRSFGP